MWTGLVPRIQRVTGLITRASHRQLLVSCPNCKRQVSRSGVQGLAQLSYRRIALHTRAQVLSTTSRPTEKAKQHVATPQPDQREKILTIPNILTLSRLAATPVIGYLLTCGDNLSALYLLVGAGLTDVVDGWLARQFGMGSVFGSLLDPLADKVLVATLVITLTQSPLEGYALPVWLAGTILGRDLWLLGMAGWWRYTTLPPPKTFTRYWDMSLPSAQVQPTQLSKINTFLQLLLVAGFVAAPLLVSGELPGSRWLSGEDAVPSEPAENSADHGKKEILGLPPSEWLRYFGYVVACTTVASGAGYIGGRGVVALAKTTRQP
ncbi:hypothetical protein PYCC9005_002169 [Savitreella phatthalungensis]